MPLIQTDSQHYTDIADAIRDMSGNEDTFYPSEMAAGVRSIPQTIAIQPIIYSLEEREVGVWTDGRPLYEKTIYLTKTTSSTNWESTTYNVSFSNCVFYSIEGVMWTVTVRRPINFVDDVNNFASTVQISPTELRWITKWTNTSQELYAYVTFRYTKTTDTPGSGTWTPSGVPAHHYSTNEQVIGTWIDGKPIYEKTIALNGTSAPPNQFVSTGIEYGSMNIKMLLGGKLIDSETIPQYYACDVGTKQNQYLAFQHHVGVNARNFNYLIIQYTKTTD